MSIDVGLVAFKGFAVRPEDVTFGEAGTKDLEFLGGGGAVLIAQFRRPSLTIILRGITQQQAQPFIQQAQRSAIALFTGSAQRETFEIAGYRVPNAVLVQATPSAPLQIAGSALIEQLTLLYESQVFI